MIEQQHPITPPPELVREWNEAAIGTHFPPYGYSEYIATQAARWGADQQLNADCEWLHRRCLISGAEELRAALGEADEPAVLSGREPASVTGQPVDGEVAELVEWLRVSAAGNDRIGATTAAAQLNRVADLLQRLSPPQPVPVSERLPGDQLCWWFEADEDCGYGSTWTLLRIRGSTTDRTHWLPAHALPLPEVGE